MKGFVVEHLQLTEVWLLLLQGFDPGQDTYQKPPEDGSKCRVEVDPKRYVCV